MNVSSEKTKWELKREASYEALVSSAMRSFHDRGYAATTVKDIVADTGYSPGAFYFHFDNKADCFWHAVAYREALRGPWWETVFEGLDPAEVDLPEVLAQVMAGFSAAHEGLGEWVLAMVDFYNQHRDDPEALARLADVYSGWHTQIELLIRGLEAGGWIEAGRNRARLATEIFAFGEGLNTHARLYGLSEASVREALIEGLVRILR